MHVRTCARECICTYYMTVYAYGVGECVQACVYAGMNVRRNICMHAFVLIHVYSCMRFFNYLTSKLQCR